MSEILLLFYCKLEQDIIVILLQVDDSILLLEILCGPFPSLTTVPFEVVIYLFLKNIVYSLVFQLLFLPA